MGTSGEKNPSDMWLSLKFAKSYRKVQTWAPDLDKKGKKVLIFAVGKFTGKSSKSKNGHTQHEFEIQSILQKVAEASMTAEQKAQLCFAKIN